MACHNPAYITKGLKMVRDVTGGKFLNAVWDAEEFSSLPAEAKRVVRNISVYH